MLVLEASTSFATIGKSADFCRGRLTGLSIAYWKKAPSFDALAAEDTLPPRFGSSRRACSGALAEGPSVGGAPPMPSPKETEAPGVFSAADRRPRQPPTSP